ncbi:type II toxin-antitoxin system VapC family toxin [Luteolibacter yonseiensis]|uniref:Type II toxin-antitoxin system VapC family toxin n=1 Tax=Luteolibacter yonseiensis TaxID=1144680 RepID=A0A934V8T8_9BACT|nr:type II toxin-antitoxin system VapC family toxin [Luteolibacter yonseiensis]MBK1814463.1 type II toxin-antitoxin system VapC family toxin [Luteolibacter yonseiensis]
MKTYADTGFLCSLYSADALTDKAERIMQRQTTPLAYTWLHQLELRNALRLRVFRKEISALQRNASLNLLLTDLAGGILEHASPNLSETMIEAERLSTAYSEKLGTRSMDIMHVAAAVVLGTSEFLSFDKRQVSLAKAAGLKVKPV